MFKKCLTAILVCSLVTGPLKTEVSNESYLQKSWNALKKKINTITQYEGPYVGSFCISSMVSAAAGLKLWLTRDRMVEQLVLDSNGDIVSNKDELIAWLQQAEKNGTEIVKVVLGAGLKKSEWISNTGESFTYAMETKLEPFSASLEYKIMVGIVGITGLMALYSAYKLFNTPDKTPEATTDN